MARSVNVRCAMSPRELLLCSAFLLVAGCSSDSDDPASADKSVKSDNGIFTGTFSPSPAEPIVGTNALDAVLSGGDMKPVLGATLAVTPWMPAHGHGSSVTPTVTVGGEGKYAIDQIVYGMPGEWELRVDVDAGELSDRFVLGYQVK